jgi:hypothetical protein
MEPFENPKYEELSMLRFQKENIKWDLGEHDDTLKLIHKAKELDKKLPEQAKNDNHYIKELKIENFEFFEDHDQDQIKAVHDIESYVKEEKEALKAELKEINSQIKSLGNVTSNFSDNNVSSGPSSGSEGNPSGLSTGSGSGPSTESVSGPSKRKREESESPSEQPSSKKTKSDDDDSDGSGPSTGIGPGPTGSGSGPSTGSGPAPSQGGSSETSNSYEGSDPKKSTLILDIMIKIIEGICGGDDDFMD